MRQPLSMNDFLREANVQFIVVVEVGKLLAVIDEARESIVSSWRGAILYA